LLEQRLKSWSFQLEFSELKKSVEAPLMQLHYATKATKTSESFKKVLGVVLTLGNYMNGGSPKGQADGFSLDVLAKLANVKDSSNQSTLLEYVVRVSKQQLADAPNKLGEELAVKFLDAAIRVSLEEVTNDFNELKKNLSIAKQQVAIVTSSSNSDDSSLTVFLGVIPKFLEEVDVQIVKLQRAYDGISKDFVDMLLYFGMPVSKAQSTDPSSFFSAIKEFVVAFMKQLDQLEKAAAHSQKQGGGSVGAGGGMMGGVPTKAGIKPGQKVGSGADPLAALANAIRLGGNIKRPGGGVGTKQPAPTNPNSN